MWQFPASVNFEVFRPELLPYLLPLMKGYIILICKEVLPERPVDIATPGFLINEVAILSEHSGRSFGVSCLTGSLIANVDNVQDLPDVFLVPSGIVVIILKEYSQLGLPDNLARQLRKSIKYPKIHTSLLCKHVIISIHITPAYLLQVVPVPPRELNQAIFEINLGMVTGT